MASGSLYSICISPDRGQMKQEIPEANVIEDFGLENDGHAGKWGRQVTCLDLASVDRVNRERNMCIGPGQFAENLLIQGIDFTQIGVGERIQIGDWVVLEVSQIGKDDHPSVVSRILGTALLPTEGLFCRVLQGGRIKKGDIVEVMS